MTEIVKVRRPLNDQNGPWLIYDRAERHMVQVPAAVIPQHVKRAIGTDLKGYFVGAWSSVVGWGLSERVEDQSW